MVGSRVAGILSLISRRGVIIKVIRVIIIVIRVIRMIRIIGVILVMIIIALGIGSSSIPRITNPPNPSIRALFMLITKPNYYSSSSDSPISEHNLNTTKFKTKTKRKTSNSKTHNTS